MRRYLLITTLLAAAALPAGADSFDDLRDAISQGDRDYAPRAGSDRRERPVAYFDEQPLSQIRPEPIPSGPTQGGPISGSMRSSAPVSSSWSSGSYYGGPPMPHDTCAPCTSACMEPWGVWAKAELIYWWAQGASTPPLVTTDPNDGILPEAAILFGNERINTGGQPGGRFSFGYWFDRCNTVGLESSTLFLGNSSDSFSASSDGNPTLARPFFNVESQLQDGNLVASDGVFTGNIDVTSYRRIVGTEINLRRALCSDCFTRNEFILGWRYFHTGEGLDISSAATSIDPNNPEIAVGTLFNIFDSFQTANNFYGGQIGLMRRVRDGCWSMDMTGKIALGANAQYVQINGGTTVTVPNVAPVSNEGGILALDSNIGTYQRNRFAVLPEITLNAGYDLSSCWRVTAGYTLLVLTNVVRPGDQIDTRVDPALFPPPSGEGTSPHFQFNESTIWLQGLNFGIECNY